jgi:hypothetical protein
MGKDIYVFEKQRIYILKPIFISRSFTSNDCFLLIVIAAI